MAPLANGCILMLPDFRLIRQSPGYKHFYLAPHPAAGLPTPLLLQSLYGEIKSGWKLEGNEMVYTVEIPANTTATVTLAECNVRTMW